MNDLVERNKEIIIEFINSVFSQQKTVPYAFISNISKCLTIQKDTSSLKHTLTRVIIKHIKKRCAKFNQLKDRSNSLTELIVSEHVWFLGTIDTFRKIFYMVDLDVAITRYVNKKINLIIKENKKELISEVSKALFDYEKEKDSPQYALAVTLDISIYKIENTQRKFSMLEQLILILEILNETEIVDNLISELINEFISIWMADAVETCKDIDQFDKKIKSFRRNLVFQDQIHLIEGIFVLNLFSKVSETYLMNALGFKEAVNEFEYYYDLSYDKEEALSVVLQKYVEKRYGSKAAVCGIKEDVDISINKILDGLSISKNVSIQGQRMQEQIKSKLENAIKHKRYTNLLADDFKEASCSFIEIFAFYLEVISWKAYTGHIKGEFDRYFKSHLLKNEMAFINCITEELDRLLRGKVGAFKIFELIFLRETSFIQGISLDAVLFHKEYNDESLVCYDLLCPLSLALEDCGIQIESLADDQVEVFLKNAIFKFVTAVYDLIEDKESFDLQLIDKLGRRLFDGSYTRRLEEDLIQSILVGGSKTIGERLKAMISDFENRLVYQNSEIMLLKNFQWPTVKAFDVDIDELNEIKKEYSNQRLSTEKIKIRWADALASCEVEIGNKVVTMSVIQYRIFKDIYNTSKFNFNSMKIEERNMYKMQLDELVSKGLIRLKGGNFMINFENNEHNYVPKFFVNEKLKPKNDEDNKKYENALLDCKIMKFCKGQKMFNIQTLQSVLDIDLPILNNRLEELHKKGYLEVKGENIVYLP